MMKVEDLDLGDVVYAAHTIVDDGTLLDEGECAVLAEAGSRGVIVMKGCIEEEQNRSLFLVWFESKNVKLGRLIGCWGKDLRSSLAIN
jgi:nitrogen fixation protein NifZ